MANEIAILMAAGMGTRMRPLTEFVPKPLVKANGHMLIESVICGLLQRGVEKIYVVTGYLSESFEVLPERFPQVELVYNHEYARMNNISSVRAVADKLGESNCFICEADLFISDPAVFDGDLASSCYFGKRVSGWSPDWVFEVDKDGVITHIGLGGADAYNMVGIAYFRAEDAAVLADAIVDACNREDNEQLFWDEVVDRNLDKLKLRIHEVNPSQICEVDTISELGAIAPRWKEENEYEDRI